jgi:hypothetical protein
LDLRKIKQHELGDGKMIKIIIKWTVRSILFKTDTLKLESPFLNTQ